MKNRTNILVERTDYILYYAEPGRSNEHGTGWIGGNAPTFFDDQAAHIHEGTQKFELSPSL